MAQNMQENAEPEEDQEGEGLEDEAEEEEDYEGLEIDLGVNVEREIVDVKELEEKYAYLEKNIEEERKVENEEREEGEGDPLEDSLN